VTAVCCCYQVDSLFWELPEQKYQEQKNVLPVRQDVHAVEDEFEDKRFLV
jgi:hypothetical protein